MEPWFGLATRLDLVCGILWAKDAREIVAEDGEVCNVGSLHARPYGRSDGKLLRAV
jgi:hypothetical protein